MSYLLPHPNTYASVIWGVTGNCNLDRLQFLQNRALRLILNAPTYMKRIHLYKELKIPVLTSGIKKLATTFYNQVASPNRLINAQSSVDTKGIHKLPFQTTRLKRRF
ncbi:hypothetical protein TNCV_5074051 [Trichonephila clavipes]|nr:hypothetical protein TNCV_5074051 [Trichonephila clavipes]